MTIEEIMRLADAYAHKYWQEEIASRVSNEIFRDAVDKRIDARAALEEALVSFSKTDVSHKSPGNTR